MQRVSASASRSLPIEDPRRYSYRLDDSPREQLKPPMSCSCPLPARPDNWSDLTWRKYLTAMGAAAVQALRVGRCGDALAA